MTGIVNVTGARSGVVGTTVGTFDLSTATFPAGHVLQTLHFEDSEVNVLTTTYVNLQNTSQTNYINSNNVSINNYILAVNNSNNNYIVYYVGLQNTSVTNYANFLNTSNNNYILENNVSVNNNIEDKLITTFFNATNVNPVTGTPAGTVALLQLKDGISYNLTEVSSDMELIVNFTGITTFNQLIIRYKSASNENHNMIIYIWDYPTSTWESWSTIGNTENEYIMDTHFIFDGENHISGGVVQVRFYSNNPGGSTHLHQFDWVAISDGPATPSSDETDPFSIHKDGNVALEANWAQGAFNLTNTNSWFLGIIDWTIIRGLNATINALIATNNASVNNYIAEVNTSMNNYVDDTFLPLAGGSLTGNLNITTKNITTEGAGEIYSNSTCMKMKGPTSILEVC